jgi:hypothetical protein
MTENAGRRLHVSRNAAGHFVLWLEGGRTRLVLPPWLAYTVAFLLALAFVGVLVVWLLPVQPPPLD